MNGSTTEYPKFQSSLVGLRAVREALRGTSVDVDEDNLPFPHRRLVWALGSKTFAGPADWAALVRHVLRWEDEHSEARVHLRVPRRATWPDRDLWLRHGCQVDSEEAETFLLSSRPWCPPWLPQSEQTPPAAAAFGEEPRRAFAKIDGDPFLPARGAAFRQYLSVGQQASVRAALTAPEGATLAVNLPTGSGKSLCAQLPALLDAPEGSLAVVVVPTVALALDQEESVRAVIGHDTAYYGGNEANEAMRDRIRRGTQRIVFTSPESLLRGLAPAVFRAAQNDDLRRLVIDEAHIVNQWGNDFRSAFQDLAGMRQGLLDACNTPFVTLLLSATFSEGTLEMLKTLFGQPGPFDQVSAARLRAEPSYWWSKVASKKEKERRVLEAVHHLPRPLILYTSRKRDVETWSDRLYSAGYRRLETLTGDTPADERRRILDAWRSDAIDLVVATSAFGLGIDKPDVRAVVHACLPENVHRFYQEVGRGGRDGHASVSLLVYYENDDDPEGDDVVQAERLNGDTILTVDTAFGRWKAMYDSDKRERVGDVMSDRYRVPITAEPRVDMQNEKNRAWNVRTLVLMHRAGLIGLEGEAPPQQREGETDEEMQERLRAYYNRRVITVHMASPHDRDEFEERMRTRRMAMYGENARGFEDMMQLLSGENCVADVLTSAYRVPRDGGTRTDSPITNPVTPIPACGGCPACRQTAKPPYAFSRSHATMPGWQRVDLHPTLQPLFERGDLLAVFHESSDRERGWEGTIRRVVRWCVERGIVRVVAPPDVLNQWRSAWTNRKLFVFLDRLQTEPPDPSAELDVPDFVYLPPEVPLPAHYLVPTVPRILLVPKETVDPRQPSHLLWDMFRGAHFRFQSFRSEVHV